MKSMLTQTALSITITTNHYPPDTAFTISVDPSCLSGTVGELFLDHLCPDDWDARHAVADELDVKANPDLPECYRVLTTIADQWRAGLVCVEMFSGPELDEPVAPDDPVERHLADSGKCLTLMVNTEHHPVEWAVQQGYADDAEIVWAWLQSMAALYLVDRHEVAVPHPDSLDADDPMLWLLQGMHRRGALLWTDEGAVQVGEVGRDVIAANLTETERLIDDFDRYSDVRWNRATEEAEFGTGRGADLRVPVMREYEADPLRSVFLLRLYDGSLDQWAGDWRTAISRDTLEALLDPVVNRDMPEPPLAILSAIIADGEDLPGRDSA